MSASDPPGARRRGRPPGRTGEDTRRRLLDATLGLVAEHGLEATSVRRIAAAVGLRDAAIYAHYPSKQALYDALLAESGPVSAEALDVDLDALAARPPTEAVPWLVDRLVDSWSAPRSMLFADVILREGTGHPSGQDTERSGAGHGHGGPRGLAEMIDKARARLTSPFARWRAAGSLRDDVGVDQLVWELFAPLFIVRFTYLRGGATPEDVETGRRAARDHVRWFLRVTASTTTA